MNGSNDDMVSVGRAIVEAITELRQAFLSVFGVAATTGSFTMPAAASFDVPSTAIVAGSVVVLQAANAAAATLQSSAEALYVDAAAAVVGTSFSVKTGGGGNAAGTEVFNYTIFNPLT